MPTKQNSKQKANIPASEKNYLPCSKDVGNWKPKNFGTEKDLDAESFPVTDEFSFKQFTKEQKQFYNTSEPNPFESKQDEAALDIIQEASFSKESPENKDICLDFGDFQDGNKSEMSSSNPEFNPVINLKPTING